MLTYTIDGVISAGVDIVSAGSSQKIIVASEETQWKDADIIKWEGWVDDTNVGYSSAIQIIAKNSTGGALSTKTNILQVLNNTSAVFTISRTGSTTIPVIVASTINSTGDLTINCNSGANTLIVNGGLDVNSASKAVDISTGAGYDIALRSGVLDQPTNCIQLLLTQPSGTSAGKFQIVCDNSGGSGSYDAVVITDTTGVGSYGYTFGSASSNAFRPYAKVAIAGNYTMLTSYFRESNTSTPVIWRFGSGTLSDSTPTAYSGQATLFQISNGTDPRFSVSVKNITVPSNTDDPTIASAILWYRSDDGKFYVGEGSTKRRILTTSDDGTYTQLTVALSLSGSTEGLLALYDDGASNYSIASYIGGSWKHAALT